MGFEEHKLIERLKFSYSVEAGDYSVICFRTKTSLNKHVAQCHPPQTHAYLPSLNLDVIAPDGPLLGKFDFDSFLQTNGGDGDFDDFNFGDIGLEADE